MASMFTGGPTIPETLRIAGLQDQLGPGFRVSVDGCRWADDRSVGWSDVPALIAETLDVGAAEARWLSAQLTADIAAEAEAVTTTTEVSQ